MYSVQLIFLVVICLASHARAFNSFQREIPNGDRVSDPCNGQALWPGVGHQNPGGAGNRNNFGEDFRNNAYRWTPELCVKDSDGDGKTNGQELGDPGCSWSIGGTPFRTTNITHPGVCDPIDSPRCAGRNDFLECRTGSFADNCDRIKDPAVQSISLTFPETQVPAQETNYFCMGFDLPSDQDYHLIATEAIITNPEVMHHILLFGCEQGTEMDISTPTDCGMTVAEDCQDVIGLWTVGIDGRCLIDNVAFRFGASAYRKVVLQSHWNNPMLSTNHRDASGLRLYYKPAQPEVNDLLTLWVGQMLLDIPPGQARVTEIGSCPSECTAQIFTKNAYISYVANHMHLLGIQGRTELFRNGRKIRDLGFDENYSYDSPTFHIIDPPVEVRPGDELRVTCVYNSLSSDRHVYWGEGTQAEMCFSFITIYPSDALVAGRRKTCNAWGPVSQCEFDQRTPVQGCDWALLASGTTQEARDLEKNCNLDGFCRPECLEVVERLSRHPCLIPGQPMTAFVNRVLQFSEAGARMLGQYHSCSAHIGKSPNSGGGLGTCSRERCGC